MKEAMEQTIERIAAMEACYDALWAVADSPETMSDGLKDSLKILVEYYHGGLWLKDYTLDEQGLLPRGLKRGVLSQDGVYDLLEHFTGVI